MNNTLQADHDLTYVSTARLIDDAGQQAIWQSGYNTGQQDALQVGYNAPTIYDISLDDFRAVMQPDLDELLHVREAFGSLMKSLRFHHMEAKNGLITPGMALVAIMEDVKTAELAARGERVLHEIDTENGREATFIIPSQRF